MPYWDENGGKETADTPSVAQFDPKRPEAQKAAVREQTSRPATAQAPKAPGNQTVNSQSGAPPLPGMAAKSAPQTSAAQAAPRSAAAVTPVAVAMAAPSNEGATFNDPDLVPPANPRTLSAHSEAKPIYEKGFVQLAKGDYEEAIRIYEDFVARFPDDLHSDNAQFWLGEAYLQTKNMDKADAAYRGVLRNFAHKSTLEGYKTPDSIYKLGQMALMKNDPRRAEYYFRNVSERFPESTAGRKALRELDTIRVNTAADTGGAIGPDS